MSGQGSAKRRIRSPPHSDHPNKMPRTVNTQGIGSPYRPEIASNRPTQRLGDAQQEAQEGPEPQARAAQPQTQREAAASPQNFQSKVTSPPQPVLASYDLPAPRNNQKGPVVATAKLTDDLAFLQVFQAATKASIEYDDALEEHKRAKVELQTSRERHKSYPQLLMTKEETEKKAYRKLGSKKKTLDHWEKKMQEHPTLEQFLRPSNRAAEVSRTKSIDLLDTKALHQEILADVRRDFDQHELKAADLKCLNDKVTQLDKKYDELMKQNAESKDANRELFEQHVAAIRALDEMKDEREKDAASLMKARSEIKALKEDFASLNVSSKNILTRMEESEASSQKMLTKVEEVSHQKFQECERSMTKTVEAFDQTLSENGKTVRRLDDTVKGATKEIFETSKRMSDIERRIKKLDEQTRSIVSEELKVSSEARKKMLNELLDLKKETNQIKKQTNDAEKHVKEHHEEIRNDFQKLKGLVTSQGAKISHVEAKLGSELEGNTATLESKIKDVLTDLHYDKLLAGSSNEEAGRMPVNPDELVNKTIDVVSGAMDTIFAENSRDMRSALEEYFKIIDTLQADTVSIQERLGSCQGDINAISETLKTTQDEQISARRTATKLNDLGEKIDLVKNEVDRMKESRQMLDQPGVDTQVVEQKIREFAASLPIVKMEENKKILNDVTAYFEQVRNHEYRLNHIDSSSLHNVIISTINNKFAEKIKMDRLYQQRVDKFLQQLDARIRELQTAVTILQGQGLPTENVGNGRHPRMQILNLSPFQPPQTGLSMNQTGPNQTSNPPSM
ncbi:hypothetical protein EJ05DRAFT_127871 [Pseudovirgaria hyperparasitica]|uniref:Uncharacterized protein n=1 Tax=Pseudovirgaria hyperparasitica TaxID=470096 RepID=A0A6A6VX62_9PEZI|nr:uncharacterized protein EJ05DRAFT_127871 [Pseudovirgaria hyperparasitica]KAF2755258.1 hypothetical protein EJ05DRAFT_127871 [Pseudovirgaria hyperparasitica]